MWDDTAEAASCKKVRRGQQEPVLKTNETILVVIIDTLTPPLPPDFKFPFAKADSVQAKPILKLPFSVGT